MTAEIAIMNKSAVALAADSAATISSGFGQQKVFNTVNKLFMLSKYHPIGIMINGGAEIMGIPWETIIKIYRRQLKDTRFDTTKEYAQNFIKFLENDNPIFDDQIEAEFFSSFCDNVFITIRKTIQQMEQEIILNSSTPKKIVSLTITARKKLIKRVIEAQHRYWSGLPVLPNLPKDYVKHISAKYDSHIKTEVSDVFKGYNLAKYQEKQLLDIAKLYFTKDHFGDGVSGFVIAGFGEKEIFPSLVAVRAECIIINILKHKYEDYGGPEVKISVNYPAAVVPFAQTDMVWTFIRGIDMDYIPFILGHISELFTEFPEDIIKLMPGNGMDTKTDEFKSFMTKIKKISKEKTVKFNNDLLERSKKLYSSPLLDAVAHLPKDELASLAESLINLTSLKRRVSLDAESVGGPIDVAVISKGDGFVWIKRKHYFRPELNPYFMKQMRVDNRGSSNMREEEEG